MDERIRLYKNLWSDAEAAVNSTLSEMKLIKMELKMGVVEILLLWWDSC